MGRPTPRSCVYCAGAEYWEQPQNWAQSSWWSRIHSFVLLFGETFCVVFCRCSLNCSLVSCCYIVSFFISRLCWNLKKSWHSFIWIPGLSLLFYISTDYIRDNMVALLFKTFQTVSFKKKKDLSKLHIWHFKIKNLTHIKLKSWETCTLKRINAVTHAQITGVNICCSQKCHKEGLYG